MSADLTIESDADRARALLELSISLVDSATDILTSHLTKDEQLTHASTLMPGGSVGKHLRHVIETFQAFLLPLKPSHSSSSSGHDRVLEIDYDAILPKSRKPLARSLEASRGAMQSISNDLRAWGESCSTQRSGRNDVEDGVGRGVAGETTSAKRRGLEEEMKREVRLIAVTPTKQVMGSTVGRELWFCSLHAIHHFSMLRTIAVHELGIELPVEFGTAPSTLLYRGPNWRPPLEKKEDRVVRSKL